MVYCSIFAHFEVRIEALLKFRVYVTGVSRFAKHTVNNKLAPGLLTEREFNL